MFSVLYGTDIKEVVGHKNINADKKVVECYSKTLSLIFSEFIFSLCNDVFPSIFLKYPKVLKYWDT